MFHCLRFLCWPLHRALQLLDCWFQTLEPTAAFFSVVLFHLPGPTPPQFSDRVQDFVGLFSLPTAVVAQSLSLSKVCDFKQLLLISVSHWCGSFLYCKETYLRLLIAVWFSVFPQTPLCCGASSSGGRGRCCHRLNGQRCMS